MSWDAVSSATSYTLQVATETSFSAPAVNEAGLTAAQYTASGLSISATYYWRVNAAGSFGTSEWSSVNSFSTGAAGPTFATPANGAASLKVANIDLSWNSMADAASYGVQISTNQSFGSTAFSKTGIVGTQTQVPLLPGGTTYYVRVNATGSFGTSQWSPVSSFTTRTVTMPDMASIPAGSFLMGSLDTTDFPNSIPQHPVSISAFSMGKTGVTQALYKAVMDTNPGHWQTSPNYPVDQITWYDAIAFCNRLSRLAGLDTVYSYADTANGEMDSLKIDYSKNGYRMPTEAEWEYAYRAGTTTDYYWGKNYPPLTAADTTDLNANAVWFLTDSVQYNNVGTKLPNPWGLYDMAGNLFTWCNDYFADDYTDLVSQTTDPTGPATGYEHVTRGGSWGYYDCGNIATFPYTAEFRGWKKWPYSNGWECGLRVVRRP